MAVVPTTKITQEKDGSQKFGSRKLLSNDWNYIVVAYNFGCIFIW